MAADTVAILVSDVKTEGGFDATDPQALRWLNRAWRKMVSEAKAYRQTVAVGPTVANQAFYAFFPIEAYSFEVAGVPYGKSRRPDIYANAQGRLIWEGDGGTIVADASSGAVQGITLVPTPTTAGLAITSFAAMMPPDLTSDGTGDALLLAVLGGDFHDELVAGAIATGLRRLERRPDEAGSSDALFVDGVQRLAARTKKRYRGAVPHQIRVIGLNA